MHFYFSNYKKGTSRDIKNVKQSACIFFYNLLLLSISNHFLFLIPQCLVHEDMSVCKIFAIL